MSASPQPPPTEDRCCICGNAAKPDPCTAKEIAEQAAKTFFSIIGVDLDNPESVEEFRSDLRFGKRMRKLADQGSIALVIVCVGGLAATFWAGLVTKIKGS